MHATESVGPSLTGGEFAVRLARRERARNADLGLNAIGIGCLLATLLALLITLPLYASFGMSFEFGLVGRLRFAVLAAIVVPWLYFYSCPGTRREWIVPETLFAWALLHSLALVMGPAQYIAAAMNFPVVDAWLAASDSALGVHVPSLAAWTGQHPQVSALLTTAYNSFQPQLVAAILVLGLLRDRRAMWEYVFIFHVCAIVTTLCSAIFPVACAFTYYGFDSTLDFSRFTAHFTGMRDGTMRVIPYGELDGLVSMPSFHAAGGMMLIWALRRHRLLLCVAGIWNTLLIAATVFSGAHYVIDVVAAAVLFGLTVAAYHTILRRFHPA